MPQAPNYFVKDIRDSIITVIENDTYLRDQFGLDLGDPIVKIHKRNLTAFTVPFPEPNRLACSVFLEEIKYGPISDPNKREPEMFIMVGHKGGDQLAEITDKVYCICKDIKYTIEQNSGLYLDNNFHVAEVYVKAINVFQRESRMFSDMGIISLAFPELYCTNS